MKQLSQGGRANQHGRSAEGVISAILTQRGCTFERQKFIGRSIFDSDLYADFYITTRDDYPIGLIIESKWQDVGGSVDEKLPYLVLNIKERYPCPAIVVLHGGGFRPGAERWLRRQVDTKLIHVFRLEEFLSWCNRNL